MAFASQTTSSENGAGRLAASFAGRRARGGRTLVAYLTAGFPAPADTAGLLDVMADAGVDIIELGIPFSDPLADGPTIQRASQRAIEAGATLASALDALAAFRARSSTPVVLFTYLNPVLAHGADRFLADAASAGADGVLLTDLPVDGDAALEATFEQSTLALIRLIAPTTTSSRAERIAARAQGFLYYVSRTGVTGARGSLRSELTDEVDALRRHARVPIAVGFGISTPEQAVEVGKAADGVVVGSALIDAIEREAEAGAARFLGGLRSALDSIG